jgi:GT2 family glycosyltransferase
MKVQPFHVAVNTCPHDGHVWLSVRLPGDPGALERAAAAGAVPGWVTSLPLAENLGCPGGRNAGLRLLLKPGDIDVIVEPDDDGLLIADDVFARVLHGDPALGIVSFRVAYEHGQTLPRHVPRLGAGDPLRPGPVTIVPRRSLVRCRLSAESIIFERLFDGAGAGTRQARAPRRLPGLRESG